MINSMLQHGQTFHNFPFDTQRFKMKFESFRLKKTDLRYDWKDIVISPLIDFHDFRLLGHRNSTLTDSNFTSAVLEICVEREAGYYYSILFTQLLVVSLLCGLTSITQCYRRKIGLFSQPRPGLVVRPELRILQEEEDIELLSIKKDDG